MVYTEVKTTWEYETDGDNIEGVLLHKEQENGIWKYKVETKPGYFLWVMGRAILNDRMAFVKVGSKIRITYKGESEKPNRFGNATQIFKVEVDNDQEI
jgi:hypothetical protein